MHTIFSAVASIVSWLAGNGKYMPLAPCMGRDTFWIFATVALDLANAAGYAIIAFHWWRNSRYLSKVPAKRALGNIRNIFVFCGICGYLFIPIKMVWPAWRLYDLVMAVLVFYTWRYALGARDLKVVYSAIGRTSKLQEDLEHSLDESRRKSLFLNAISHHLRSPLNSLMLQTHVAEINLHDPQSLKSSLAEIRTNITAAASLLDKLLEFARLDWSESKNDLASNDLRELIDRILLVSHPLAQAKGLYLQTKCPSSLIINTDRVKLERILTNLISNAVKFTERGGVRVEAEQSSEGTEIYVIDTGIGIASEEQKTLFQEFVQIHNHERDRKKGFGLGLAISRHSHGNWGATSSSTALAEPDPGSRFYFQTSPFPTLSPNPESNQPSANPSKSDSPTRGCVLLVEDDAASSVALRTILTRLGWNVVVAENVAQALPRLSENFDFLILDLMLPDGDGAEILRHARSLSAKIRVVVTTGVSDPQRLNKLNSLTPNIILRKPIDLPSLIRFLETKDAD